MQSNLLTCKKCSQEKPVAQFAKDKRKPMGVTKVCVDCSREYKREWARGSESHKAKKREYRIAHRGMHATASKRYRAKNPEKVYLSMKGWQSRNTEKRTAHITVGNAVRDGKLKKGHCEICGCEETEAHHDDYSKPLQVRWLCHRHHISCEHVKNPIKRNEVKANVSL